MLFRSLQSNLAFSSLIFIKFGCFVLSMGELYFDIVIRGTSDISIFLILQAVVTAIMIMVPVEDAFLDFYTYSGDEAEIKGDLTFDLCKKSLDIDYRRANPMTCEDALLNHIQLVNNIHRSKKIKTLVNQNINTKSDLFLVDHIDKSPESNIVKKSLDTNNIVDEWDIEESSVKHSKRIDPFDVSPGKKLIAKDGHEEQTETPSKALKFNQVTVAHQKTIPKKASNVQHVF